jgi:HJR/Mrr/RecB family endonuclease
MVGVEPPKEAQLSPGPRRDLVLALHDLYRGAGRPGLRRIADAIRKADAFPDTVSHETASALLRGEGIPRWPKLECLVRQLSIWHHPRLDPEAQVAYFLILWNAVNSPAAPTSDTDSTRSSPREFAGSGRSDNRASPHRGDFGDSGAGQAALPAIWGDLPYRNKEFTGRSQLLQHIYDALHSPPETGAALALYGLPGAGKTQVAIEYAYRHKTEYDVVWKIPSTQAPLVRSSLAALAGRLDIDLALGIEGAATAVADALRRGIPYNRCLLIFDGANDPEDIVHVIPDGPSHVLVTSRNPRWRGVVNAIEVGLFSRSESIEFVNRRTDRAISENDCDLLASEVGDLPQALAQGATLIADNGMSPSQYCQLLQDQPTELLEQGNSHSYETPISSALKSAMSNLRDSQPQALGLLHCLAFFGSGTIPLSVLRRGAATLSSAKQAMINELLANPILLAKAIDYSSRYGLARVDRHGDKMQIHKLTQAILRDALIPEDEANCRHAAQLLLAEVTSTGPTNNAAAELDNRPNLLDITPAEFEYLVRQLFEAIGMKSWVTQESGDGGADAVAINDDPVFGGMCIIQAKRYRSAVGIESIRALAGVVEDRRAMKGIMVTTSWVTKEGHAFAQRHGRIEIIEGQSLKNLCKDHLRLEVRIDLPKPPPQDSLRSAVPSCDSAEEV